MFDHLEKKARCDGFPLTTRVGKRDIVDPCS